MKRQADGVLDLVWDDKAGPVENIMGLIEYGLVFVPGWRLTTIIMAALGLGPKRFGKWIDQKYGLNTLDDVETKLSNPEKVATEILEDTIGLQSESSYKPISKKQMIKNARSSALFSKILGSKGLVSMFAKFISSIIEWAKKLSLGGLGVLSLKGIHSFDNKEPETSKTLPNIPVSIKEKPNLVRHKLEEEVDNAFSL